MVMIVILVVIVLIVLYIISMYNSLVRMRNTVDKEWKNIDVQLERRYALIPNLVETVKGYAKHEQDTLTQIAQLRSAAMSATNVAEKAQFDNQLTAVLAGLRVSLEAYPDLKANQNFLQLQEELTSTENKISFSRHLYNDVVTTYNTKIQVFPSNIMANMFGFKEKDLFEVSTPEARTAPKVSF
ncbi:MAG: LemA family protein [Tannerellaceae bacterium]